MTPPALVALDRISVRFPIGRRMLRAVDGVSLDIAAGETLALVGESGSGKSTLGNVVSGLQTPTEGTLRFEGRPLDRAARRAIQVIFQDPFGALDPRMPVAAIIGEPLRIGRIGTREARQARVGALVRQVGLPADALNRYPHEFSGGQRQRIAVARALAPAPRLIVADEPLSALDVSIQSQVLNLLREMQERAEHRGGLAYLFISHDLGVVNHLADRVAVLYLGRIVELASRAALFARPAHPYTEALLAAVPRIGRKLRAGAVLPGEMPSPLDPPRGCHFHPRCPRAAAPCRGEPPPLAPVGGDGDHRAACYFPA